jgi:plasmid stabilization system protein ParE
VKARFEPAARAEFLHSVRWYADEAGGPVARRFEEEVRHVIQRLLENPMLGAAASHGLRRHPMHRYPYTIYYRVEPEIVRIIAIAHQSRRPDYWTGRR